MEQAETRRIMVVDDEPRIADSLADIFRSSGYSAAAYYDGRTALEACIARSPHFVISDITMPGINGVELAILIRQRCPACKILLFSGLSTSFDLVEQAKRSGHSFEILEKPVSPALLLKRVATELDMKAVLQFPRGRLKAG